MKFLDGIKNIIFDFGGVIININASYTIKALKKLKFYNADKIISDTNTQNLLIKYEQGLLSTNEFLLYIKQHCAPNTNPIDIIQAWNAMILDIPHDRIQILKKLRESYNIFLLSNTNQLHYQFYSKLFERQTGMTMQQFFKKVYFSFEIKLRKPHIDIYNYVLSDSNLLAEETLFIDDTKENLETAQMLGIRTYWLQEDLTNIFKYSAIKHS